MHGAKRFAGCNAIANFAMQNNTYRWIDCVFFLLAPAAENYACCANGFTVHGDDISVLGAFDVLPVFRARKLVRVVERAYISTLQRNHLAKLFERFSRRYQLFGFHFAIGHRICGSSQVKHPARKFETQVL